MENLAHAKRNLLSKDGITGFSAFILVGTAPERAAHGHETLLPCPLTFPSPRWGRGVSFTFPSPHWGEGG